MAADPVIPEPDPEPEEDEEILDPAVEAKELFDSVVAEIESGLPLTISLSGAATSQDYMLGTAVYSFGQDESVYDSYLLEMLVEP